jgi:hypothetical protein
MLGNIVSSTNAEVVDNRDLCPSGYACIHKVAADKTGASSNRDSP